MHVKITIYIASLRSIDLWFLLFFFSLLLPKHTFEEQIQDCVLAPILFVQYIQEVCY